jgi:D-glycero-alpha-D-manno-heptose-7-phosphate kinase
MVIARAPVRISFGGGGTDLAAYYQRHGGFVVSAAIDRYCSMMAHRPADGGIRITSSDYDLSLQYPSGNLPLVHEPLSLPKAALARFGLVGLRESGIDLFTASEVPPGTGLGSSSAMACALVRGLSAFCGRRLTKAEVAGHACELEIEYLGMPIGRQDQYASAFGGLNAIEFNADGVTVNPIRLPSDVMSALSRRLLLFSTGSSRHSASILNRQRADSSDNQKVIDSLNRIKELAHAIHDRLLAHDLDGFGRLLDRGWQEKKRLSAGITTAAIDGWYQAARDAGALGGKITGAGGGGFLLLYTPPNRAQSVREVMAAAGLLEMTFDFDRSGAQVLTRDQPSDRVVNAPIPRRNRPAEWHRRQTLVKTEEVIALARTD